MVKLPSTSRSPILRVLDVMAALRSPEGCPWDREQDHQSLRWHAVEEVYELVDAIEAGDDEELLEELGDLLLQVVFHARLAEERGVFRFDEVCAALADKLIRRHPHVFGEVTVEDVDQVWAQWEKIKREEKQGTARERTSPLDGIPRHLPALLRAQKLVKKATKAGLAPGEVVSLDGLRAGIGSEEDMARTLFGLAGTCQQRGWSAEELLTAEIRRQERRFRDMLGPASPEAAADRAGTGTDGDVRS
jgi:MazG family protein